MKHNARYFKEFFSAIPDNKWCVSMFNTSYGALCANGHLGCNNNMMVTPEVAQDFQKVLSVLTITSGNREITDEAFLWDHYSLKGAYINNGEADQYRQRTPKERIMAAIEDVIILEESNNAVAEAQTIINEPKINELCTA